MAPKVYLYLFMHNGDGLDYIVNRWLLDMGVHPILRKGESPLIKEGDYDVRYKWVTETELRLSIWRRNSTMECELHEIFDIKDTTKMPHYAFEGAIPYAKVDCPTVPQTQNVENDKSINDTKA